MILTLIWCILGKCKSVISGKKIHNSVFSLWWRHVYRTAYYVMITCDVITEATYRHHDISHVMSCERNITWWKLLMPKFWEIPRASSLEKKSNDFLSLMRYFWMLTSYEWRHTRFLGGFLDGPSIYYDVISLSLPVTP